MNIFKAVFLGLVQGLTEFLPVSSSGHLVLLQNLFGISENVILFDITLHLATLLAVCAVFYKDIWQLVKHPLSPEARRLYLATVPTVIIVLIFEKFIRDSFGGGYLGFGFLVTAVMLLVTDLVTRKARKSMQKGRKGTAGKSGQKSADTAADTKRLNNLLYETPSRANALIIGAAQGIAVLPGISRSGATISAGLICGMEKEKAARFSFLMSIPVIIAGALYEFLFAEKTTASIDALPLLLGFIAAAVSGYIAIRLMLHIVSKRRMWGFSVYLVILAVITFIVI